MFRALTQYPSLERLLDLHVPTLVVIGDQDPLMPGPARIKEIAGHIDNQVLLVVHRGGRARDQLQPPRRAGQRHPPVHGRPADRRRPGLTGHARVYEIHRGSLAPPVDGA